MNQTEHREIIRDDYSVRPYESIRLDGNTFIFDYRLRRFLEGEEKMEFLKQWIEGTMDFESEVAVEL